MNDVEREREKHQANFEEQWAWSLVGIFVALVISIVLAVLVAYDQ